MEREEASAKDETQGWSAYSPHAGRCRTCCSAADPSDNTTPRRCSGGRSKARRSFPLALPDVHTANLATEKQDEFREAQVYKERRRRQRTKHKVGRHIPHMQVDAGRAALQQTSPTVRLRAGAQEDEARRGGLSARSPRRAHSKPPTEKQAEFVRGASVEREEASAKDETQGWSAYSPHAGRCRTCYFAADLSDSTTPRRCSGGRSKARRSFRSLSQTRTQQTSLRRNRTSFERRKCTKRGGVGKGRNTRLVGIFPTCR